MAIVWGLDLNEIHWTKFKGSYMFTRIYHLRRTKMIVYQLAMILCVCSESVGTAALSGISFFLSSSQPWQTDKNLRLNHIDRLPRPTKPTARPTPRRLRPQQRFHRRGFV